MTKCGLLRFLLLFLVTAASGQKAKYKDMYTLLSAKQYAQAEPFLRSYLRENTDNPNAYLFMGHLFQDKASASDILRETDIAVAYLDSAIGHYRKVRATLDDRELRRNREYYEAYHRRDLRTGEFGVKLSDIQFDLEKKEEALKERISRVKVMKRYFALADSLYRSSNALFAALQRRFPSVNSLYLRAGEATLRDLERLAVRADSAAKAFGLYQSARGALEKGGEGPRLTMVEIADFTRDGRDMPDLYGTDVRCWDYAGFARNAAGDIATEILPVREELIARDKEISELRQKLESDGVSVRPELALLAGKIPGAALKKFDPEPLPVLVLEMKAAELEYRSLSLEHDPWRDSADVQWHVGALSDELKVLWAIDSLAARAEAGDVEARAVDYDDFVRGTFGNTAALKTFVSSAREFASREEREKRPLLDRYTHALEYIADGADSIPLSGPTREFFPLVVAPEEYTIGLSLRDSVQAQGYFYTITPSRHAEVKASFPLAPGVFSPADPAATRALGYADSAGHVYYVLLFPGMGDSEKIPATVVRIHRSDGLASKQDIALSFDPDELALQPETGDLIIRNGGEQVVVRL